MSRNLLILRSWFVLTVIVISLVGAPVFAQGGTTVRVDPAASSAQVNDRVETYVKVDNISNLVGFEVHLAFDPSVLEVVEVTNGDFVAADITAQNVFDNTAGTIDYAVAQMNRPAATGSGALLHIAFRAKANGSSSIALRNTSAAPNGFILSDGNGSGIQASWVDGVIRVGSAATSTATPITPVANTVTPTPVTPGVATATQTPITPVVATVTRTPTVTATLPSAGARIHIVRVGETLFCVGRAYGVWPFAIAEVNHIWWPYTIYPNQKLMIPTTPWSPIPAGPICPAQFSPSAPTITPAPVIATASPSAACRLTYVVRRGDTLYRIAVNNGTNYTELARINQIPDARLIYVGQQLCIP